MANDDKHVVLVSISTKTPDRTYIEIDGKEYGVRVASEIELKHLTLLQKCQDSFNRREIGTDQDDEVMSDILDKMCRVILLDVPDRVHKQLKDMHRMAIVSSFIDAVSTMRQAMVKPQQETSTDELPDSSDSTAEPSAVG